MKIFQPMTGDGVRAKSILHGIRLGHIKRGEATKLLQQARVDDMRQAAAAAKNAGQP